MGVSQPGHDIAAKERTVDVLMKENVSFKDLLLSPLVLSGLQKARFERPSPIQLKAIPLGRCGLDLIVQAKSGTGKTCVFTVIALEALSVESSSLQVIVLAPTREIAVQIEDVILAVGQDIKGLKVAAFIGGRPLSEDKLNAKGCQIAVGSPGRIFQLVEMEILKCQHVRIFVLDEADKLLEDNFQSQINSIYSMLPVNKQMIAASATYPEQLANFVTRYMRDPTFVRLNPKDMALLGVKQFFYLIENPPDKYFSIFEQKTKSVVELLKLYPFQQALIFSNYHSHAKDLSDACNSVDLPATFISGNLEQERRLKAMKMLKDFKCKVLISTDLTSRGIDASNVDLVVNLDVPTDWETFMHRTGRAGRFGSRGAVISVVTSGKEKKALFRAVESCAIKIYQLSCDSGSLKFGSAPVNFNSRDENNETSPNRAQNFDLNTPKAKSTEIPNNSLNEPEQSQENQKIIIPSLPELMSRTLKEDSSQYSYTYTDLMENYLHYKETGVFKKLKRIDGGTTIQIGSPTSEDIFSSGLDKKFPVRGHFEGHCNDDRVTHLNAKVQKESHRPNQGESRFKGQTVVNNLSEADLHINDDLPSGSSDFKQERSDTKCSRRHHNDNQSDKAKSKIMVGGRETNLKSSKKRSERSKIILSRDENTKLAESDDRDLRQGVEKSKNRAANYTRFLLPRYSVNDKKITFDQEISLQHHVYVRRQRDLEWWNYCYYNWWKRWYNMQLNTWY